MKRARSLNLDVPRQEGSEDVASREASNSPITPIGSLQSSKDNDTAKKKRGPTRMGIIKDKYQRLEVEWNEKGQPVGYNSISFVSFLGATIRENIPIIAISWEDKKEDLWTMITQRYDIEDYHFNYLMQAMGNYWRQHRSKISRQVRKDAKKHDGRQRAIAMCRPENVSNDKEWDDWVKYILSSEYDGICRKFKKMRAKHKLEHATGRQGCARLEHSLDEMAAYVEDNGSTIKEKHLNEDPVAKVLGPERRGRVRGLGFGATPSKLNAVVVSHGRVKELEKKLETQDCKVQVVEKKALRMDEPEKKVERVDKLEENLIKLSELYMKQTQQNETTTVDDITPRSYKSVETNEANKSSMPKENARCELLHRYNYDSDEVVVEGKIASTDPKARVHHMPLGRDCWKLWVENVISLM